jgi:hypothetical protein
MESVSRMTLSCKVPNLLLAVSANKAVIVHDTATPKESISPKYCIFLSIWLQSYNKKAITTLVVPTLSNEILM